MQKISKTIITDELLQKTMLTNEVRVLTPNGRSYAPRINLSVELDSSSRASADNTTTKTRSKQ